VSTLSSDTGRSKPNARHQFGECSRSAFRLGRGTDATRVSSYNPYLSLYWLITGKTIGGLGLYPEENRLDRGGSTEALHDGQQLVFNGRW